MTTQKKLFDYMTRDISEIKFDDELKDFKDPVPHKRLQYYHMVDDKKCRLLVKLPPGLTSFGVIKNFDKTDPTKLTGYSINVRLWRDKTSPTLQETKFIKFMEDFIEANKKAIVDRKVEFKQPRFTDLDVRSVGEKIIYYPQDENTGELFLDKPPSMFLKLQVNRKNLDEVYTNFVDKKKQKINPLELIGKWFNCVALIIDIQNLFNSVGKRDFYIQFKLSEVMLEVIERSGQSLLEDVEEQDQELNYSLL